VVCGEENPSAACGFADGYLLKIDQTRTFRTSLKLDDFVIIVTPEAGVQNVLK
jgi:hypothetical protein